MARKDYYYIKLVMYELTFRFLFWYRNVETSLKEKNTKALLYDHL